MYVATIEIQLKKVKGNPLAEDQQIAETIDNNIISTLKQKLEAKFNKDGIETEITTTVQWLPETTQQR